MSDLARLYDLHAEDCVRTAEKVDNPSYRAMLLKAAEEWRQAARQLQHTAPSQEQPLARNCTLKTQPHVQRGQEGVGDTHETSNRPVRMVGSLLPDSHTQRF